jgi:hypothetical protein
VFSDNNHDGNAFAPGLMRNRLYAPLTRRELAQAVFRTEPEALEVAEAIEAEAGDFAFEPATLFMMFAGFVFVTARSAFSLPAAEASDFIDHLLEITADNRVPTVLLRDGAYDAVQVGLGAFDKGQNLAARLHEHSELERPEEMPGGGAPLDDRGCG